MCVFWLSRQEEPGITQVFVKRDGSSHISVACGVLPVPDEAGWSKRRGEGQV